MLVSDAKEIVNKKKNILEEVVKNLVDKYNNQLGSLEKNVDNLQDKIAKGAANKLMDSAKDINNRDKILSILDKANIEHNKLGLIINYIETITPEDEELYAIVKEINQSVDNFWFQLDSGNPKYRELFSPDKLFNSDTLEFAETLNAARKDLNTRQADIKNTTFEVILENININLYLGNEIFVENNMLELLKNKSVTSLNKSRYVLFELPMNNNFKGLKDLLFNLQVNGYIPFISN